MNIRTVGLTRCSAATRATMIVAVSAWAFLNSTACGERDPFQIASTMAANAKAGGAQTVGSQGERPPAEVSVYTPPDLLAAPPPCLGKCA
jgi:hypothetical protein